MGGTAREMVLGPGKNAVLNSTYRPALPNPINGLSKESRIGFDFSYSGLDKKDGTSTSDLTGFDIIAYGLIPLYYYSKKTRPSGLTFNFVSSQQSGLKKSTVSSNELANDSQSNLKSAIGKFRLGGIFSISNDWMMSLNLLYQNEEFNSTEKSIVSLSEGDEENRLISSAKGNFVSAEYGFRLKLTRDTSVAITYNDGYFNKEGVDLKTDKQFLGNTTTTNTKTPLFSQSQFSFALKTRYFSSLTFAFGLLRAFEIKTQKETGKPVILAEEFSNLGLSFEYRFRFVGKTWLPRIGFETQTLGRSQISAGLSIQQNAIEFDTGIAQSIKNKGEIEDKTFVAVIGIGYRFIDDSDEQEDGAT